MTIGIIFLFFASFLVQKSGKTCIKHNNDVGISYEVQTSVGAEGDEYVGLGKMLGESTSLTSLGEMTLTDDGFTYPQSGLSVRKILPMVKLYRCWYSLDIALKCRCSAL